MFRGTYNAAMSGIMFPLVTASGTYAKNYNPTSISGIFIGYPGNGGYTSLSGRISGIPGDGVYTLASLTAAEMQCENWAIKITANSGCLDQTILGQNITYTDSQIIAAVSGLKNDVSGLPGILAASSGPVVLRPGTHTNALVGLWGSTHTSSKISVVNDLVNAGEATVDLSSVAAQIWNSLAVTYTSSTTLAGSLAGIYTVVSGIKGDTISTVFPALSAVSGLVNDISGLPGVLVAVSSIVNNVASGFAPILTAIGDTNISAVAAQVWNTDRATYTSATTFGGSVPVSGLNNILGATSGLGVNYLNISGLTPMMTQISSISQRAVVSGLTEILAAVSGLTVDVSGLNGTLVAVSNIPGCVASYPIGDAESLVSGTIAHTMRLMRWFAWEDLYIDKTYLPNRLYLKTDATNYSSWWSLIDNVNYTERIRGG